MKDHPPTKTGLLDLPVELLDEILLWCITIEPVTVSLAPIPPRVNKRIKSASFRGSYIVANYPHSLLLTNRLISQITFSHIWHRKSLVLSMSVADSLCFLQHALSERQRDMLRRVRFPRLILSWTLPVGADIWLCHDKNECERWYEDAKTEFDRPNMNRLQALMGLLAKRLSLIR